MFRTPQHSWEHVSTPSPSRTGSFIEAASLSLYTLLPSHCIRYVYASFCVNSLCCFRICTGRPFAIFSSINGRQPGPGCPGVLPISICFPSMMCCLKKWQRTNQKMYFNHTMIAHHWRLALCRGARPSQVNSSHVFCRQRNRIQNQDSFLR